MEKFFKFWFIASLWVLAAFAGWYLERFSYHRIAIVACLVVFVLALLLHRFHKRFRQTWKGARSNYAKFGLLFLPLILGTLMTEGNVFRVNDWMNDSIIYVKSEISPVQYFTNADSKVVLSEDTTKKILADFSSLHIENSSTAPKILVSFLYSGLILLEGKSIIPLYKGHMYLSSIQPDNSIIYLNTDQFSSHQTLTKAIVRNNALYKIWERKVPGLNLHHWGDEFNDLIYLPGKDYVRLPNEASRTIGHTYGKCVSDNAQYDTIRIFDFKTGKYERSIDLLPIIASLKENGEAIRSSISHCHDPLHFNSVKIVKDAKSASFFPNGKIGDILISLRDISTVMLLDKETLQVKWQLSNQFKGQHDPTITERGTMLVFDNKGSDAANGTSRVDEFDIASGKLLGMYEATGNDYFQSGIFGHVHPLGSGHFLVDQEYPSSGHDVTLSELICPTPSVSSSCKRTMIFSGPSPKFRYYNAVPLYDAK